MPTKKQPRRTTAKKATPTKKSTSRRAPKKSPKSPSTEEQIDGIKESLEYELLNKDVRITVKGVRLTFTAWGLTKEMQFGGRVISLVNRLQGFISPDILSEDAENLALLSHLLSIVADDVLDIVSGSISDPFKSANEAREWIDTTCDFKDLFDMGVIIYDQNIKGDGSLGKRMASLQEAMGDLGALISASKKTGSPSS